MAHSSQFFATVFMNGRDVTPWVSRLSVTNQPKVIWRTFGIEFAGWSSVEEGASWNIFLGTNPSINQQECVIRDGVSPASMPIRSEISRDAVRTMVSGYDYVWKLSQRRPRSTLVLAGNESTVDIRRAIDKYLKNGGPSGYTPKTPGPHAVGRYSVVRGATDMKKAVRILANRSGVGVQVLLPNYKIQTYVVGPERTYWQAIADLVVPFAPISYFDRWTNTLWFEDSLTRRTGTARWATFNPEVIRRITATASSRSRPSRVIVRASRWY